MWVYILVILPVEMWAGSDLPAEKSAGLVLIFPPPSSENTAHDNIGIHQYTMQELSSSSPRQQNIIHHHSYAHLHLRIFLTISTGRVSAID